MTVTMVALKKPRQADNQVTHGALFERVAMITDSPSTKTSNAFFCVCSSQSRSNPRLPYSCVCSTFILGRRCETDRLKLIIWSLECDTLFSLLTLGIRIPMLPADYCWKSYRAFRIGLLGSWARCPAWSNSSRFLLVNSAKERIILSTSFGAHAPAN